MECGKEFNILSVEKVTVSEKFKYLKTFTSLSNNMFFIQHVTSESSILYLRRLSPNVKSNVLDPKIVPQLLRSKNFDLLFYAYLYKHTFFMTENLNFSYKNIK